jgi:hypothetical protein
LLITNIEIVAKELPVVAIDNTELPEDSEIGTVIGTLYNVNESIGEDIVFELETNPDELSEACIVIFITGFSLVKISDGMGEFKINLFPST